MRRSPDRADSLCPAFPPSWEFSNNPLAGIECIRRRIEKRMQALFVCGCRHELQLACQHSAIANYFSRRCALPAFRPHCQPGLRACWQNAAARPVFTDVHRLVQLYVPDPQWHIMSEVLTHRITILTDVSRLAKKRAIGIITNLQTGPTAAYCCRPSVWRSVAVRLHCRRITHVRPDRCRRHQTAC